MEAKTGEIAKTQNQEVDIPRRISGGKPQGFDELDIATDIKPPRIAILQPTSKAVTRGEASMGNIFDITGHENFGKEIEFIPLFLFKSRAKFDLKRGLVLRSRDNQTVDFGVDEFEQYVGVNVADVPHDDDPNESAINWLKKTPPSFALVYNFMVVLPGDRITEIPLCISLMKTAEAPAKDFLGQAAKSNEDMFARVYKMKIHKQENDKGTFFVPTIEFSRRCTDTEYEVAGKVFQEIYKHRAKIQVDLEQE